MAFLQFLGHVIVVVSSFGLVVGTFFRLTVKDAVPYFALFYYASPPILLALAAFILAGRTWFLKQPRRATALFFLALLLAGWWHWTTYQTPAGSRESSEGISRSVLFWNVQDVRAGWPKLIEEIRQYDPDLIGLVEVESGGQVQHAAIERAFPEYQPLFVGHGYLLVRGEWLSHQRDSLGNKSEFAVATARFDDGTELEVALVDINANPFLPRGPALRSLAEKLSGIPPRRLCLMGDFNTPPDSIYFEAFRERLENIFEVQGEGYHVTWPVPVPVLCLDQIWLPKGATRTAAYHSTRLSDHRLVTATFVVHDAGRP
ncbi:MAG: endonuclease/exonuclease/phosphatase family protein [Planctomycetaceae bacterium]|nr:endonuclease/exonuclease/phosphatase family protein [Planctomycetaceae bacterium]